MSTLQTNKIQHLTSGFNNVVQFVDGAGTENGTLCRAWVNFNGTGTVAIRGSFNVTSITDNGTGDYTVNFSSALADANYSFVTCGDNTNARFITLGNSASVPATGSVRVSSINTAFAAADILFANVAIFR